MTFSTLKDLVAAVRRGEVAEDRLRVVMDNDSSSVYLESLASDAEPENIYTGRGHYDVEDLWPLVLPKAEVEWC